MSVHQHIRGPLEPLEPFAPSEPCISNDAHVKPIKPYPLNPKISYFIFLYNWVIIREIMKILKFDL